MEECRMENEECSGSSIMKLMNPFKAGIDNSTIKSGLYVS